MPSNTHLRDVPYRLVKVEWEDSARPISAWQWIDDYEVPETVTCVSVVRYGSDTSPEVMLGPTVVF